MHPKDWAHRKPEAHRSTRNGSTNACKHKNKGRAEADTAMFALRRALRPLNVAAASLTTLQLTKCDEKKGAAVGIDLGPTAYSLRGKLPQRQG